MIQILTACAVMFKRQKSSKWETGIAVSRNMSDVDAIIDMNGELLSHKPGAWHDYKLTPEHGCFDLWDGSASIPRGWDKIEGDSNTHMQPDE